MNYATHTLVPGHPEFVASIMLELAVDRNQGGSIHRQWTQPLGSVMVTGVYTHVFPGLRTYEKGFTGWYRLHASGFSNLRDNALQNQIDVSSGSDMD